jgi:hypothetical protein
MAPPEPKSKLDSEYTQKPWKYIGYRGFTTFLDSDNNFLVFRRYGVLNARLLLSLQDKIAVEEKKLQDLELKLSRKESEDVHNGSFRQEMFGEREDALNEIYKLIKEYNDLLIQYSTIRAWPNALERNIQSVGNWLDNMEGVILDEEQGYIKQPNDLFALAPKEKSPLGRLFGRSSCFDSVRAWKKKSSQPEELNSPWSEFVTYTDDAKVERFVRFVLTIIGMVMLIAPLWILAVTHGMMQRLGVITIFILLLLVIVASTTTAKSFENLAATAAYAAVHVVFLQITD